VGGAPKAISTHHRKLTGTWKTAYRSSQKLKGTWLRSVGGIDGDVCLSRAGGHVSESKRTVFKDNCQIG